MKLASCRESSIYYLIKFNLFTSVNEVYRCSIRTWLDTAGQFSNTGDAPGILSAVALAYVTNSIHTHSTLQEWRTGVVLVYNPP